MNQVALVESAKAVCITQMWVSIPHSSIVLRLPGRDFTASKRYPC